MEQMNYIFSEFIFVIIVLIITLNMNKSIVTMGEIRHFRNIQIAFVVGALSEIIWCLQMSHTFTLTILQAWIVNGISLVAFSILQLEWFRFIAYQVLKIEDHKMVHAAVKIQKAVMLTDIILTSTSIATGLVYQVNMTSEYIRGPLYLVHVLCCYSNWMWTTLILIRYAAHTGLKERKKIISLFLASMIPFFGGIFQLISYDLPFIDASVMLGTLLISFELHEERITTDALTGLNNRSDFLRIYESMVTKANTKPFVLFVADINSFKSINDKYGHLKGDEALLLVADTFRKLSTYFPGIYISRYGGDEFVVMAHISEVGSIDAFIQDINRLLQEQVQNSPLPFNFTFSIGYQLIQETDTDLITAFGRADEMMYEKKKKSHCKSLLAVKLHDE